jgi:hypothetical protein
MFFEQNVPSRLKPGQAGKESAPCVSLTFCIELLASFFMPCAEKAALGPEFPPGLWHRFNLTGFLESPKYDIIHGAEKQGT